VPAGNANSGLCARRLMPPRSGNHVGGPSG